MNTSKLNNLNKNVLSLFGSVVDLDQVTTTQPLLIEDYGVLVTPKAHYAEKVIRTWLRNNKVAKSNLNKTMFSDWKSLSNKSVEEIAAAQYEHYLSTYGTDFNGEMVVEDSESEDNTSLTLTVVGALNEKEIVEKAEELLASGVALDEKTVNILFSVLDTVDYQYTPERIDKIKNKEALCVISDKTNVLPTNPEEIVRVLVYKGTGSTLLIKDKNTIEVLKIKNISIDDIMSNMDEDTMVALSTVFNRFKPLFLAIKKNSNPKVVRNINYISKLSKINHKPMVVNPLNQVTSKALGSGDKHWLENATVFNLVKALNAIDIRGRKLDDLSYIPSVFKIRNGKTWTEDKYVGTQESLRKVLNNNRHLIIDELYTRMGNKFKDKKVYIPEIVQYAVPTSQKMMLGGIPFGTVFESSQLAVGIYWENKYGARDLDLSTVDISGDRIGWGGAYGDNSVSFSGDITNAPNGAVEYIYAHTATKVTPRIVTCNIFSGGDEVNYKIIVSDGKKTNFKDRDTMMNAEDLVFNGLVENVSKQSSFGIFEGTVNGTVKFTLMPLNGNNARVSGSDSLTMTKLNALKYESDVLKMNDFLVDLGAVMVDDPLDADLDLSIEKLDTSTLIDLLKV